MTFLQRVAAAITLATLYYAPQFRLQTDPRNRFLLHWERSDALSLIIGVAILAAILTAGRALLASCQRLRKAGDHLFAFAIGGSLISTFLHYADYKSELLYLALATVVTASFFNPRWRFTGRTARVAAAFSPLAAILAWQAWSYPVWHTPHEEVKADVPARTAHPIYIIVCDEWSFVRSTEAGEFLPLFKNIRALAGGACVFDNALSAGPRTDVSIPRFLWQRTDDLGITPGSATWPGPNGTVPSADVPSIFADARANNYSSALLGFYLPYRRLLGPQAGSVVAFNHYPKSDTLPGKIADDALRNLTLHLDPLSRKLSKVFEQSLLPNSREKFSRHWESINHGLLTHTLRLIAQAPPNQFAFIHLPLPHCPWIFNPDGTYSGPYKGDRMSHDAEGYRNHLAYLDLVLGKIFDALRRKGDFDNAAIILTSDHGWRLDHTYDGVLKDGDELRHVPLLIKLPGQHDPVRISRKFHLTDLRPTLNAIMRGDPGAARAALIGAAGSVEQSLGIPKIDPQP